MANNTRVGSYGERFYKIVKNEDAPPYYYKKGNKGFLIAADGLGGSGSFVHKFTEKEYRNIENKLKAAAFGEYFDEQKEKREQGATKDSFDRWIDELFEPMIDKTPDTSALWASRIVIARFARVLIKNFETKQLGWPQFREEIINYAYEGLERTQKQLNLKLGDVGGQSLLPTTLTCIKYEKLEDNKIQAEVVWAGDSRAYAVLPDEGLKQLSIDDEDGSGAITNLFTLGKEGKKREVKLNYRKFIFPAKCMLFVCSDGIFDPYSPIDNIGVEDVFLEALFKSNDFEEFNVNWKKNYDPMNHDDCSVAFMVFGYGKDKESFKTFKNKFIKRQKLISESFNRYKQNERYIPYALGFEDDPKEYISERVSIKADYIGEAIARELISNPKTDCAIVTPEIKELYEREVESLKGKRASKKLETEKNKSDEMEEQVKNNPSLLKTLFKVTENVEGVDEKVVCAIKDLIALEEAITKKTEEVAQKEKDAQDVIAKISEIDQRRDDLIQKIAEKIEEISFKKDSFTQAKETIETYAKEAKEWNDNNSISPDVAKLLSGIDKAIKFYEFSINAMGEDSDRLVACIETLQNKTKATKYNFAYKSNAIFYTEIMAILTGYREVEDALTKFEGEQKVVNDEIQLLRQDYQDKVLAVDFEIIVRNFPLYLSEEGQKAFGLPIVCEETAMSVEDFKEVLIARFESDGEFLGKFIDAFKNATKPTPIDCFFNEKKLKIFREFKNLDLQEVLKIEQDTQKLLADSMDLSKYEVKE